MMSYAGSKEEGQSESRFGNSDVRPYEEAANDESINIQLQHENDFGFSAKPTDSEFIFTGSAERLREEPSQPATQARAHESETEEEIQLQVQAPPVPTRPSNYEDVYKKSP